jgi:dipeptidyl aminopeptidase/acylaminoacyl peptidase
MRRLLLFLSLVTPAAAQQPFTLRQVLSAPYALSLTAAPVGARFAWIENAEGMRNIWVGAPNEPARQITHNTDDDGQDISNLAWSPDANAIAYTYGAENGASGKPANPALLQRNTALQIVIQPLDSKSAAITIGEGRAPLFTSDGNSLLFLRSGQIWISSVSAASGKTCWLPEGCSTANPAAPANVVPHQLVFDRGSASQLTLSPDGKQLAFVSTRSHAGHTQSFIALFDLFAKSLRILAPSTQNDFAPAFSPDGKSIAWLRYPTTRLYEFAANRTSPNPWSIQLYDLSTNTSRTVFAPEANKPGSILPHMATGEPRILFVANNRLLFSSDAADGWPHLFSLRLDHPELKPLQMTLGSEEIEDVSFDTITNRLWFATNFDGYDKQDRDRRHVMSYLLGEEELGAEQTTRGTGDETRPVSSSGVVAALVSNALTPMHPALIANDGTITPLHHNANPSSYPATQLITPQQVLFPSTDNLTIHSQLFLPLHLSPGKHPALIYTHGGPRRQMLLGYPGSDYYSNGYAFNQYLASRGFIVLSVNYRCGIGYGLNFRECEHAGPTGAAEYNDILAAQKYLASRADVDPARIGLWGGSYGGYLTALGLARNSNLFAAGVDFHGVHEWSLEDDGTIWPRGTTPAEAAAADALAHSSSPMAEVDKWRSPVLLIHGDDDPDVAFAQTPLLADALRARGVHVEELIFPNEVHDFLLHKDWLAAFEAAASFFERKLQPQQVK